MKIHSLPSVCAQTLRGLLRPAARHPYQWSVGLLVVATACLLLMCYLWLRYDVIDNLAFAVLLATWAVAAPLWVGLHFQRINNRRRDDEARAAQLDAAELAAHNAAFESLRAAADAETRYIPLPPKPGSIYFSAQRAVDREEQIVRQRLAAEMAESTGDVRS